MHDKKSDAMYNGITAAATGISAMPKPNAAAVPRLTKDEDELSWSIWGRHYAEACTRLHDVERFRKHLPRHLHHVGVADLPQFDLVLDGVCDYSIYEIRYKGHTCYVILFGERHDQKGLCPQEPATADTEVRPGARMTVSAIQLCLNLFLSQGAHLVLEAMTEMMQPDRGAIRKTLGKMLENEYPLRKVIECNNPRCSVENNSTSISFLRTVAVLMLFFKSHLSKRVHYVDAREEADMDFFVPFDALDTPKNRRRARETSERFLSDLAVPDGAYFRRHMKRVRDPGLREILNKHILRPVLRHAAKVKDLEDYTKLFVQVIDPIATSAIFNIIETERRMGNSSSSIAFYAGANHTRFFEIHLGNKTFKKLGLEIRRLDKLRDPEENSCAYKRSCPLMRRGILPDDVPTSSVA